MTDKLVVGIDLGMTFTGVAYATQNMPKPFVIQDWPGKVGQAVNKVPTVLTYTSGNLTAWGFLCQLEDDDHPSKQVREWFKLFLNPRVRELYNNHPDVPNITQQDVRKWYLDFLRELYIHVASTMDSQVRRSVWVSNVEFIFSVPTTWTRQGMIEDFRAIITEAGFGSFGPGHKVDIGLTEAEAAAVYTVKESVNSHSFSKGDTFLVCDAGGGTTDIAVLELISSGKPHKLKQLDVVNGIDVGSTQIDRMFEEAISRRLEPLRSQTNLDQEAAHKITRGQFQQIKCMFGRPAGNVPVYQFKIPGLDGYTNERHRVVQGRIGFPRTELQRIFDSQVKRIIERIDRQLASLAQNKPGLQISFLVLSGGLGSSRYVQDCLRTRYITGHTHTAQHSNTQNMEILISDEPFVSSFLFATPCQVHLWKKWILTTEPNSQLAVVKGVVADRIQKLTLGPPIMGERCCRASYGMVCTEVYDRARHMGLPTWTDPLDRRLYVPNQIDWFVKKGEPVSTDHPIKHPFTRKIDPNGPRETWKSRLVTSDVDLKFLPRTFSLSQSSSQLHCTLESDLTHIPLSTFKKKNRHWYNKGNAYYRASYSMHVVIGSADLRFELWMDGTRHSEGVPIRVQWDPVVKENTQEAMNRDGVRLNALD